jgi:hypothetical protein
MTCHIFPIELDIFDTWISFQLESAEGLHIGKEFYNILVVINLVILQIQTLKLWQMQKILTSFCTWNNISLKIKIFKLV